MSLPPKGGEAGKGLLFFHFTLSGLPPDVPTTFRVSPPTSNSPIKKIPHWHAQKLAFFYDDSRFSQADIQE